jgi:hypothetical protein
MAFNYSCFVSYRHNDNEKQFYTNLKNIIQSEALTATNKTNSFFDEVSIKYGEEWDDKIYIGVNGSYFFIPILHYNYLHPDNNWCARELIHALKVEETIRNKLPENERKNFFYIIPFIYRGKPDNLPKGLSNKKALSLQPFEYLIIKNDISQELINLKQQLCDTLTECYKILDKHNDIDFQALFNTIPKPDDKEVNAWILEQKNLHKQKEAEQAPVLKKNGE